VKAYLATLIRWKLPKEIGHNPVGGWSVVAMLVVIAVQGSMGLFGIDEAHYDGPLSKFVSAGTARLLTELHEDAFNVILVLVGVHLAAITLYLVVFRKNLVSPIIKGTTLADATVIPARVRLAVICLALAATIVIRIVYLT
jgi:cytochrome b